ncbi:putative reverse transcriptase domain-containing protein [Tanacetum coccineum]
MMCTKMVPEEEDRVEKFIGGLPDNIQGNVIAAEPTRLMIDPRSRTKPWKQARVPDASGRAYALGGGDANSALLDITPYALIVSYAVELADGRTSETNTVFMGCTLGLLGHLFNIDMMPIELGSFDIIIGMDWLAKNHTVIFCDEKIVRIPYGIEILIVQGDKRLNMGGRNRLILELLKKEELYAKFSKCDFWLSKVQFLGHVIDSEGIHVDLRRLTSSKDWRISKTPTEIRQFLGLAGYYRRFIKGFSKIAKPMTKLTQKSVKFNWGEKEETAFQTLKQKLCSAPILALPEGITYTRVKADEVVADALSRKNRPKPLRVRALVMTIGLNLPTRILNAQVEARKEENYGTEDLLGMIKKLEPRADGTMCLKNRSLGDTCFGVLYGRKCRSPVCWAEVGDAQLTGPEIVRETTEKIIQIKHRLQASRDRQKCYADKRRKPLEFQVGDKVMLKVSPWKGVIRFGKRGKLNPRYIGPFKILAKVGTVAYRLELPEKLSRVHSTFHVSNLKKCLSDEPLAIPLDEIHIDEKLHFIEEPVEIMDREVKRLKQSRIPIVKVRWNSKRGPEYTWEREDQMQKKYPHLFAKPASTSQATS